MKVTQDTAKSIIKHHFGKAPKEVHELPGGLVNFIYHAEVDEGRFVVRIAEEAQKLESFQKEQWAIEKAREKKVPVPEILSVSIEGSDFPYMITRWMDGTPADKFAYPERGEIIRELGKYAALINSVPTSGFGHTFDWSSNVLSRKETWKDYLEKEFDTDKRLATFESRNMLTPEQMSKLRGGLREVAALDVKPNLNHGDLRLKNMIVDKKGKIKSIFDWEFCTSNITPQWDMCIALDEFNLDERALFLEGYGMTFQEYRNIAKSIKVLNILNFAPFVEVAFEEKNDAKRKIIGENMRTRLRGAFDMYSLDG